MSSSSSRVTASVRLVAAAAVLTAIWLVFQRVDGEALRATLGGLGAAALTIPLLQLIALSFECVGWRAVLGSLGAKVEFLPLLRVRVTAEALAQSLPGGAVWSESAKPYLLKRWCEVPLPAGVAAVAGRKLLVVAAHAVYVSLAFVAAHHVLVTLSVPVLGAPILPALVLGAAVFLAAMAGSLGFALSRGAVATRALRALSGIRWRRLRNWLGSRRAAFERTDDRLAAFVGKPRRLAGPAMAFLAAWLVESAETYLILHLVGLDIDFATVLAIEVVVSFLRSAIVLLPAGIGVQEVGYVAFLAALNVDDAVTVGAAFLLLKRAKELLWIAVGYLLLVVDRGAATRAPSLAEEGA